MFMCDVTKALVILFTVNYCLFANSDVSFRLSGKNDNVGLECYIHVHVFSLLSILISCTSHVFL